MDLLFQLILPYRGDAGDMLPLKLCGDLGQVLFQPYNLKDDESIYKSLMYSNTVINLVGRDWETKNYSFDDVHVEGARRIARIAKEAGVETFIHLSSMNVTEKPEVRSYGSINIVSIQHVEYRWYTIAEFGDEFSVDVKAGKGNCWYCEVL